MSDNVVVTLYWLVLRELEALNWKFPDEPTQQTRELLREALDHLSAELDARKLEPLLAPTGR